MATNAPDETRLKPRFVLIDAAVLHRELAIRGMQASDLCKGEHAISWGSLSRINRSIRVGSEVAAKLRLKLEPNLRPGQPSEMMRRLIVEAA